MESGIKMPFPSLSPQGLKVTADLRLIFYKSDLEQKGGPLTQAAP
jgi:hypothetical protein